MSICGTPCKHACCAELKHCSAPHTCPGLLYRSGTCTINFTPLSERWCLAVITTRLLACCTGQSWPQRPVFRIFEVRGIFNSSMARPSRHIWGLLCKSCVCCAENLQAKHGSRLPVLQSNMYPRYYQNDFHFQTHGWFSSHSARVYELGTEGMFLGRQDAMQRATFIPIAKCDYC
jgi:hypothetical protein